jgi:hypothetical protein
MTAMVARKPLILSLVVASGLVSAPRAGAVPAPADVVSALADRLVARQASDGTSAGGWLGEEFQTGTIVAGLVAAYERTCDERYAEAADAGAEFLAGLAGGVFLGDEAYALTRLTQALGGVAGDRWLSAVDAFYANVRTLASGGTAGYILQFGQTELSGAVFYLAHHVMAAHGIGAADAEIWREGLLEHLASVDDSTAQFPVMSLGAATWALASTGPLDDSPVDPSSEGSAYWQGRTISELPELLAEHQVEGNALLAGSFYWRFDHGDGGTGGPVSGYTEDLVFGLLGLVAAAERVHPQRESAQVIAVARGVLLNSLEGAGVARQHVFDTSDSRYVYSGEVLQVLARVVSRADLDLSGQVGAADFVRWAKHWQGEGCLGGCAGRRCDFDCDGRVQYLDFATIARQWLE